MSLLDGLNEQQRAAVGAGGGPVLVLAGPGSGKTRVLTHRVAYLIQEMNVPADALLAVTFTNKAAGEMRERVEGLLGGRPAGLQVGTFHAICARILRREGRHTPYGPDYVIYDTDDQVSVVGQAIAELNIDTKRFPPRRVLGAISSAKNELLRPADYVALDYFGEVVARVYARYQSILLDNNALDFDDLLMQMVYLLRDDDSLCQKYQRAFEFVLVDEFQDTNTAQYELVRLLAAPQNNVFVVGDEDQGIYAFRGADFRNVLRFREDYPGAQVVLLEQNYRSTQTILDAARAIIDRNPHRTPKALFTDRGGGPAITVHEAYNENEEAQFVVDQIDLLRRREDHDWTDFAVMYRTNAQSRALEEACIQHGIPYRLVGGVGFYKRREVRDLLAYLRVVNNGSDKVSFSRIINLPRRGIGKQSLVDFQRWAADIGGSYDDALTRLIADDETPLSSRAARLFAEFGQSLLRWRELAASGDLLHLLDTIISEIGYNLYLSEISDDDQQALERGENVQELRGLLLKAQETGLSLSEFLAEQSLVADVDALAADADAVTLLTLHAAKGLEFPVVFITGLEEGMLPHMRAFDDPDGLSEERRLMYVGVTRAEDRLFLTYAFRRTIYGSSSANSRSRFLADLPGDLLDGAPPGLSVDSARQSFREQTRWNPTVRPSTPPAPPNPPAEPHRSRLRDKIVPFPGMSAGGGQSTRFKSGARVQHKMFGVGTVIISRYKNGVEEVDVAFKESGVKRVDADFLAPADS